MYIIYNMFQINTCNKQFIYKPYPVGNLINLIDPKIYDKLVEEFPEKDLFEFKKDLGKKFSLSEINNSKIYFNLIKTSKLWSVFFKYVKSNEFKNEIFKMLKQNNIDLGLVDEDIKLNKTTLKENLKNLFFKKRKKINSRFEFSMMSANEGHILPHTDSSHKLVTIVIPILKENEWDKNWGGNTSILEPIDEKMNFNQTNKYLKFNQVKTINEMAFQKNSSTIFIKTFNSLHCVFPMKGPINKLRKSLTINIEYKN